MHLQVRKEGKTESEKLSACRETNGESAGSRWKTQWLKALFLHPYLALVDPPASGVTTLPIELL